MKKIAYLAISLTVLAWATSCEKNILQSQDMPDGEYRKVTVTAGSAQTKTSVNGGTLTWSANDKLNIAPQSGSSAEAALDIKSGAGTATGTFEGTIDASITDVTALYGWCGGNWTYNAGSFSVNMPANQTYVNNGLAENAYPSIGTGTIKDGITLTNPMGVLKLNITSSISVKKIVVTSKAHNLAGSLTVDKSTYAVTGGSSKSITIEADSPASNGSGVYPFYVVVPPGTYDANDLTVSITQSNDNNYDVTYDTEFTVTANNVTVLAISSCLAAGTKITMADGSTKKVEDIVEGDLVRTFDHETGQISSAKICLALQEEGKRNPLILHFASGNALTIAGQHGLLEKSSRKYALISINNVEQYVGKSFYNAQTGAWDKLLSYEIGSTPVDRYAIYSAKHLNVIAENMLTVEDDVDFYLNIYELDANLKADAAQLAADIAKYGLCDIARDFPEFAQYQSQMEDLGCKYVYIAIGKGLVPASYIKSMKSYWMGR